MIHRDGDTWFRTLVIDVTMQFLSMDYESTYSLRKMIDLHWLMVRIRLMVRIKIQMKKIHEKTEEDRVLMKEAISDVYKYIHVIIGIIQVGYDTFKHLSPMKKCFRKMLVRLPQVLKTGLLSQVNKAWKQFMETGFRCCQKSKCIGKNAWISFEKIFLSSWINNSTSH